MHQRLRKMHFHESKDIQKRKTFKCKPIAWVNPSWSPRPKTGKIYKYLRVADAFKKIHVDLPNDVKTKQNLILTLNLKVGTVLHFDFEVQNAIIFTCFCHILLLKSLLTDGFTTLRFKVEFKFCLGMLPK